MGTASPSGEPSTPLPVSVASCSTELMPPPLPPAVAAMVSVFPDGVIVTFAPAAKVTAPLRPFRLVTPAAPPPSSSSRKLISKPEESWEMLASWAPASSTEPVPPVTVAVMRALVEEKPGTTSATFGCSCSNGWSGKAFCPS